MTERKDEFDYFAFAKYRSIHPIQVILECTGEYMNEDEVKFVNIQEDFFGADSLTFVCPICGQEHVSARLG
jgi:hypothetical protein